MTTTPSGIPQPSQVDEAELLCAIQEDVIQSLKRSIDVLVKFEELQKKDKNSQFQNSNNKKASEEVREQLKNVKELALRMAVVAPMKAGKSTITNAIVGQEVLPSRNSAMTALPTEIVLDDKYQEPSLIIQPETLSIFNEAVSAIRSKLKKYKTEITANVQEKYPHLLDLIDKIDQNQDNLFSAQIQGTKEICNALKPINDLVRLCSIIVPSHNPIEKLESIPQIFASPFYLNDEQKLLNKSLGNLVIIDTPGPNEAGDNIKIQEVFADQLKRSGIVLIVLDFTQLKTKAAEEVKNVVNEIARIRGGKESIYAVINKIDQRRPGDMNTDELKLFAQNEFDINPKNVYELSALKAFVSASFLLDIKRNYSQNLLQMNSARNLAREILGEDWEGASQLS